MTLQDWIAKWSKPYWMPKDPRTVVRNLSPEHIGQLNLMWVMVGRGEITQGFFDQNLSKWELAGRVSVQLVRGIEIREYATVFNEAEFYEFVRSNPQVFNRYMSMATWHKIFKVRTRT